MQVRPELENLAKIIKSNNKSHDIYMINHNSGQNYDNFGLTVMLNIELARYNL